MGLVPGTKITIQGRAPLNDPVALRVLSGVAVAGTPHPKIDERLAVMPAHDFSFQGCPVVFWDVFGKSGHPLRSTISEMGPLLLSSLLGVNETQSGILYACFRIADEQGLLLLDLKDLRAMLVDDEIVEKVEGIFTNKMSMFCE